MDCESLEDLSLCDSPQVAKNNHPSSDLTNDENGTQDSEISTSSSSTSESLVSVVKKKISKPSVLPTFLPPCRICNAKASGFHYGVNTCEACKAFYRRSIGNEDSIKPCISNGSCAENPTGRISCTACRHKKCLELGMAKKGCRKGRYTYEKRTQDTKEFRKVQAEKVVLQQIETDQCQQTLRVLVELFSRSFADIFCFITQRRLIVERVYRLVHDNYATSPLSIPMFSPGPNSLLMEWAEAYTSLVSVPETYQQGLRFMMDAWFCELEKHFHGIAIFATQIPGFSDLLLEDRIILLKTARGGVMHSLRSGYM